MLSQQQIKTAAKWWADKLRRPSFDNGDSSTNGGMATMMALMTHQDPGDEGAAKFEEALSFAIGRADAEGGYFDLSVDYHPSKTLNDALTVAGLSAGVSSLPWKTYMKFTKEGVQVKEGYGADLVDVPLISQDAPALVAA